MAVLSIGWQPAARVAPAEDAAVVTPSDGENGGKSGEGDKPADPPRRLADKPMLVYVADASGTEGFDKVEKVVLTDDKVVIGSHAFRCIKMTPEQAAQDPILATAGKETPRIVLVSADYKDTVVLEGGKLSVGGLWSAMQTAYGKFYEGSLEKNVKALLKVLNEFDKIANERKVQDAKEAREDKPSAADKAEWKKLHEELDAREKKASKERDTLMKFEKKASA
jgi:hypothetical protein